jgi:hypothetical protein
MTTIQIVGLMLVASPFILIFLLGCRSIGFVETVLVFVGTVFVGAVIGLGVYLAVGGATI